MIDSFIHKTLKKDTERFYKARVLVAIIFSYQIILLATNVYLLFYAPLSPFSVFVSVILVVVVQVLWLATLWCLRKFGLYELCCNFALGATAIGIAIGVAISGGPVSSPATSVNVVPIIVAFVLLGKHAGLVWTQVVLGLHLMLLVLGNWGVEYPQFLDMRYVDVNHGIHWLITYCAIMGLMMVFDTLNSRLKNERDEERARFAYLASHDSLTDLSNRYVFNDRLEEAMERSKRNDRAFALFFIDLDGLKPVNDTFGHDVGDRVLTEIAHRLKLNLRKVDSVFRLGGDEFAVIVESIQSAEYVEKLASKLVDLLGEQISGVDTSVDVSGSIGIAIYPDHNDDLVALVKCADTAMYNAKEVKNTWCVYGANRHQSMTWCMV